MFLQARGEALARLCAFAGCLCLWSVLTQRTSASGIGEVAYEVNGITLTYNLRPVLRHVNADPPGVWSLKPGAGRIPFVALTDGSFVSEPRTKFGASVTRLRSPVTSLEKLPAEARPGGEAQYMFFPKNKPVSLSFALVGERRWLVSTRFEDAGKQFVENQTYWGLE